MGSLDGKTALVTGGSRGIGRAICQRLALQGASIVLHYNSNRAAAEETASSIDGKVRLIQADVSSIEEIERMFAELGDLPLDFLINNAGVWGGSPMGSTTAAALNKLIDTNLRAPFWITQCALRLLKDGGRIVNLSSVAGRIGVVGGRSVYGATKAAIDALTRNWALELAPRKILVNAVAPGYITTDMTAPLLFGSGDAGGRDPPPADGEDRNAGGSRGRGCFPLLRRREICHRAEHQCQWRINYLIW